VEGLAEGSAASCLGALREGDVVVSVDPTGTGQGHVSVAHLSLEQVRIILGPEALKTKSRRCCQDFN
jgi:hypothetical protein